MEISEIKNKELRELAELRRVERDKDEDWIFADRLADAFLWEDTKEGKDFWDKVDIGIITELPTLKDNEEKAYQELKSDIMTIKTDNTKVNINLLEQLKAKDKEIEELKERIKELEKKLN